jgi:hypothetical protein
MVGACTFRNKKKERFIMGSLDACGVRRPLHMAGQMTKELER